MENKKESNQEQVAEIIKKILGDNVQVINIGKVNQQESKNLDWDKLGEVLKQAEKAMSEYITTKTKEEPSKNIPKTLKQIEEEMESNIGKKGKIKNHPDLKDDKEVTIKDMIKGSGQYVITTDGNNILYANYESVLVEEDKWHDIHISGYNVLGFDSYEILIKKGCIDISGTQNAGNFNEKTYIKRIEGMEITKVCAKNIDFNKEKVINCLLNYLLKDKHIKELDKISAQMRELTKKRIDLRNNINTSMNTIRDLKKELMN